MEEKIKINSRVSEVKTFIRKYTHFIILGVLIIALSLTIVLGSVLGNNTADIEDPSLDVEAPALVFGLPLQDIIVLHDYSETHVWNKTLELYETHRGIDLGSSSNVSSVFAVLDGKVTSITNTYENGSTIAIEHADGFVSIYSSLGDDITVSVGDSVKKGDKIGEISDSAGYEVSEGEHLHFELLKNDAHINPNDYLDLGNK